MSTKAPELPSAPKLHYTEIDERILDVKLFIDNVKSGHIRFQSPDDMDMYGKEVWDSYNKRANWFYKNADVWLEQFFKYDFEPDEFKELTKEFHKKMLYWHAHVLVKGKILQKEFQKRYQKMRSENRALLKLNKELIAQNTAFAKELAQLRRPPVNWEGFTGKA